MIFAGLAPPLRHCGKLFSFQHRESSGEGRVPRTEQRECDPDHRPYIQYFPKLNKNNTELVIYV